MNNLLNQLTDALVQADAVNLEKSKEWALHKLAQLQAYKDVTPILQRSFDQMFGITGGKAWYEQMSYGKTSLLAFVEKNNKKNAEKRNAKIAAQLEKAGITEVISGDITWNKDGFDGVFKVNTDKGVKTVRVETIYAGGYNIQCFHVRTLVKII